MMYQESFPGQKANGQGHSVYLYRKVGNTHINITWLYHLLSHPWKTRVDMLPAEYVNIKFLAQEKSLSNVI